MHTFKIKTENFEALIHHNGDWSGDVIINYRQHRYTSNSWKEIEIPGEILLRIGEESAWQKVKDDIISHIEGLE